MSSLASALYHANLRHWQEACGESNGQNRQQRHTMSGMCPRWRAGLDHTFRLLCSYLCLVTACVLVVKLFPLVLQDACEPVAIFFFVHVQGVPLAKARGSLNCRLPPSFRLQHGKLLSCLLTSSPCSAGDFLCKGQMCAQDLWWGCVCARFLT